MSENIENILTPETPDAAPFDLGTVIHQQATVVASAQRRRAAVVAEASAEAAAEASAAAHARAEALSHAATALTDADMRVARASLLLDAAKKEVAAAYSARRSARSNYSRAIAAAAGHAGNYDVLGDAGNDAPTDEETRP